MAVPNATLEAVMKAVQLDLLATAPRRQKVPERVPSKVHTGIEPAEEERPPAAVYLPDGAKAVSIVRAPSPDSDEYAEATVVHLKRFTGYVTDEEDDSTPSSSSPPAPSPLRDGRSMPRPPPPAESEPIEPIEMPPEPQPTTVRAVTVSTIPEAEEDEYEDIEIEAAALLPRAAFVRASASPQSSSDPVSKFEQLYDLVRLGDADALYHALTTDFSHAHVDSIWHNDCTLLQVASSWGHAHIVRMLLLLGADPNMCKHASATAAHFAAMNCFKSDEYGEALRALVSYGANLTVKGAGSAWNGEKSPEEVLLLVNRRFAMAQSTSVERRRIGLCLSNMFAYNTSLLPNVTIVLGPTEWRHRIDRALEHWNQHAPEQRGLILYAGAVPADLPAYLIGTRKVPESCVVWAAQVQDTAQAALHAHRILSHYEGNPKWRTSEAAKLWNDYKGMELSFENYAIARFELKVPYAVTCVCVCVRARACVRGEAPRRRTPECNPVFRIGHVVRMSGRLWVVVGWRAEGGTFAYALHGSVQPTSHVRESALQPVAPASLTDLSLPNLGRYFLRFEPEAPSPHYVPHAGLRRLYPDD